MSDDHTEALRRHDAAIGGLHNGHETLVMQMMELIKSQERIADRLDDRDKQIAAIREELGKNTVVTTEVRDYLEAFKGGFKVLGWMGTGLKWISGTALAIAGIYGAWKTITGGAPLK